MSQIYLQQRLQFHILIKCAHYLQMKMEQRSKFFCNEIKQEWCQNESTSQMMLKTDGIIPVPCHLQVCRSLQATLKPPSTDLRQVLQIRTKYSKSHLVFINRQLYLFYYRLTSEELTLLRPCPQGTIFGAYCSRFLQARCPSWHPINSVYQSTKYTHTTEHSKCGKNWFGLWMLNKVQKFKLWIICSSSICTTGN